MRGPWEWNRRPLALPPASCVRDGDAPCVIHLVRAANGIGSLREFAAAMRAHPPGVEHELVLAMKGFDRGRQAAPYIAQAADLNPTIEFFPDLGFDLGLLFAAVPAASRPLLLHQLSHTSRRWRDGWPSCRPRSRRQAWAWWAPPALAELALVAGLLDRLAQLLSQSCCLRSARRAGCCWRWISNSSISSGAPSATRCGAPGAALAGARGTACLPALPQRRICATRC